MSMTEPHRHVSRLKSGMDYSGEIQNLPFTCRVWRPAQRKKYNPSDRVAAPDWQGDE